MKLTSMKQIVQAARPGAECVHITDEPPTYIVVDESQKTSIGGYKDSKDAAWQSAFDSLTDEEIVRAVWPNCGVMILQHPDSITNSYAVQNNKTGIYLGTVRESPESAWASAARRIREEVKQ